LACRRRVKTEQEVKEERIIWEFDTFCLKRDQRERHYLDFYESYDSRDNIRLIPRMNLPTKPAPQATICNLRKVEHSLEYPCGVKESQKWVYMNNIQTHLQRTEAAFLPSPNYFAN
jgi:hypothetical protein